MKRKQGFGDVEGNRGIETGGTENDSRFPVKIASQIRVRRCTGEERAITKTGGGGDLNKK